jgi:hypothetical protein
MREKRLTCDHCGKDTFAFRRENGLEVKYRDRWLLILNDARGTVLFRCRVCGSVSVYSLAEHQRRTAPGAPTQSAASTNAAGVGGSGG